MPDSTAVRPVWRFLRRFVLIGALLGTLAVYAARPAAEALLPLFAHELAFLDPTLRIDRVSIDRDGLDTVVRLEAGLARPLSLNGRTYEPDPRGHATASTLLGNLVAPWVLLLTTALAWPATNGVRTALRALLLLPALLLQCMLVVPFILWAALWGLILQVADPTRFSVLLLWSDFLLGGGGFALALALGACVGHLSERAPRR